MLKRVVHYMLFISMLILPLHSAFADDGVSFELKVSKSSLGIEDIVEVEIYGKGLEDVFAYELALSFDPSKLQYVKSVTAEAQELLDVSKVEEGQLFYGVTTVGKQTGWSGDGVLGTLQFKAFDNGQAKLELKSVELYSSQLREVSYSNLRAIATVNVDDQDDDGGNGGGPNTPGSENSTAPEIIRGIVRATPVLDATRGEAVIALSREALDKAIEAAKRNGNKMTIEALTIPGSKSYVWSVPGDFGGGSEQDLRVKLVSEFGALQVGPDRFRSSEASQGSKTIGITSVPTSTLDASLQESIGDRPVISIQASFESGSSPIVAGIPYEPSPEERSNPESIVVWHIDAEGNANPVINGIYSGETGMISFSADKSGTYAVTYDPRSFEDIAEYGWAQREIRMLAARGVIQGVSDTEYNPDQDVTRGEFITLLVRTLGLSAPIEGTFSDIAKSDFYYEPAAIARALGIASGSDGNQFNPSESITRQDMMVLVSRALAHGGQVEPAEDHSALNDYSDNSGISNYALSHVASLVEAGIIVGSNNQIYPQETTSRAEAAVLMHRLVSSTLHTAIE
jgi:hypothetical protein